MTTAFCLDHWRILRENWVFKTMSNFIVFFNYFQKWNKTRKGWQNWNWIRNWKPKRKWKKSIWKPSNTKQHRKHFDSMFRVTANHVLFCSTALTSTGWVRMTIKPFLQCPRSKQCWTVIKSQWPKSFLGIHVRQIDERHFPCNDD
jgi:hypothetical protein